jgi:hypothetical protein
MTGPDLRAIREARGLSLDAMGRALGYQGRNVRQQMHRYESRPDPVPPRVVLRLIEMGWWKPKRQTSSLSTAR